MSSRKWRVSLSSPYRSVVQARALLLAADGAPNHEIALRFGVSSNSVRTWRRRFEASATSGAGAIVPGNVRRSPVPQGTVAEVERVTTGDVPGHVGTHWSTRAFTDRFGMGQDTVARNRRDQTAAPRTS